MTASPALVITSSPAALVAMITRTLAVSASLTITRAPVVVTSHAGATLLMPEATSCSLICSPTRRRCSVLEDLHWARADSARAGNLESGELALTALAML